MVDAAKMQLHDVDIYFDNTSRRIIVFHALDAEYILGYFQLDILTFTVTNHSRMITIQETTVNNMKAWQEYNDSAPDLPETIPVQYTMLYHHIDRGINTSHEEIGYKLVLKPHFLYKVRISP